MAGPGAVEQRRTEQATRENILEILNGIGLGNFFAKRLTRVVFTDANKEISVKHALSVIPEGFFLVNIDKAATVYDSGRAWTTEAVYLKCDVAGTQARIYILG